MLPRASVTPAALAALDKEWASLWVIKTWDVDTVCEYDEICNRAKKSGKTAHFGCVFDVCTLKGSELPEGDLGRIWKGRVCFQAIKSRTKTPTLPFSRHGFFGRTYGGGDIR